MYQQGEDLNMGKVVDISAHLTNERPTLKLGEGMEYKVNDRKSTMLLLNQKMRDSDLNDIEEIDKILKALLGEEAVKEIDKLDPPFAFYQTILEGAIAAVMGEDLEVTNARFQES